MRVRKKISKTYRKSADRVDGKPIFLGVAHDCDLLKLRESGLEENWFTSTKIFGRKSCCGGKGEEENW